MQDLITRVASRYVFARDQYFEVGDRVTYGKYKNHSGKIIAFGKDKWGNPTVVIEPIPKGRKQNKEFGLFKIWRADVKEKALAEQKAEEEAQKALTARVSERSALTYLPKGESGIKGLASPEEDHLGWQYSMGFLDAGPLPHLASKDVMAISGKIDGLNFRQYTALLIIHYQGPMKGDKTNPQSQLDALAKRGFLEPLVEGGLHYKLSPKGEALVKEWGDTDEKGSKANKLFYPKTASLVDRVLHRFKGNSQ